jgi:two-component system, NarL family, response regulator NreC
MEPFSTPQVRTPPYDSEKRRAHLRDVDREPAATFSADAAAPSDIMLATVGPTNPIRLLLVDDKLIVREGVRAFLEEQSGFHVIAQAASVAEAAALDVRPDVVVTDLVLPDARGTEVVVELRNRFAHAAIFVLTDVDDHAQVEQIVAVGVGGYVLKTATAAEFLSGLRAVAQGVSYVQPSLRSMTARTSGSSDNHDRATIGSLTAKEREVLRLLALGHTNAEIAQLCTVSLRTVEARRARVLQKLGVRTRAELVRVAHQAAEIGSELT